MRVLIVEDDRKLAGLLQKGLQEEGHQATVAHDGPRGLELAQAGALDVIVLDLMLPVIDGFEITRRIRAASNRVPILMLTGRDADDDIVRGLNIGADDYLTKPFSFEVLLARLRALNRRLPAAPARRLQVADLVLDRSTHQVYRGVSAVALTRTEFSILQILMQNAGRVVPRSNLLDEVWGHQRDIESNTLDVFIRNLRSKVDSDDAHRLIHTVRGIGYSVREGQP